MPAAKRSFETVKSPTKELGYLIQTTAAYAFSTKGHLFIPHSVSQDIGQHSNTIIFVYNINS